MGAKLKTIQEWRDVANNPPQCCVNCEHYSDSQWGKDERCRLHEANPPQEYAEEENDCPSWQLMIPF